MFLNNRNKQMETEKKKLNNIKIQSTVGNFD